MIEQGSMQSKGGQARAEALSPEQRHEIAQQAAAARWGVQKATHTGVLTLGGYEIECHVLEDGTRLLSRVGVLKAIGRKGKAKGGRAYDDELGLPVFLTAQNLKPFITDELIASSTPIHFIPSKGGSKSIGYRADLLPLICGVFMDAEQANALMPMQSHIVQQCKILLRGLATVGITALVDEATGYQEVRDHLALQKILDMFISKELSKWAKRFPDEFYREMFRLKNWQWQGMKLNRPSVVGHYTNDVVYQRLASGVLDELKTRNPPDESGHRKHKHHQWLTPEVGHPKLRDHLNGVIALMRASSSWDQFKRMVDRVFPKLNTTLELPFPIEDEKI